MTMPNTASKLTWPDDRSLKSAARLPVERSRASSAEDAANDGRPRRARSSEPRGGFAEGPKLALTLEEAAAELSVSTATIRRMITRGSLRAVRLGDGPRARRRVSRSALDEFLNAER
jgi:excisionase family DNA binding protein